MRSGPLDPALVERVLEKLGLAAPPGADLAGLTALYGAWCRAVPFDNVQKRIALAAGSLDPLPGDDAADFFERWLGEGTGGTCWAGNGALCELLLALGFPARRGLATMLVAPGLPPNHGTVTVGFDEERYLVDASILHEEPLRLARDATTRVGPDAWATEARFEDAAFVIRWRPLHLDELDCRIDVLQVEEAEFSKQHEATRAWSPFNYQLSARIQRETGPVGAALGEAAGITRERGRWQRPFGSEERLRFLVEVLGIREATAARLPADEALPPPPGAPTAEEW